MLIRCMKLFLIIVFSALANLNSDNLINSVWSHHINRKCVNTLTFKSNELVLEYDCEIDYSFHSSYKVKGDTIVIKGKDDSHSEDNGKISFYWITTYLKKNGALYLIENKTCDNGKWTTRHIRPNGTPAYARVK